MTTQTDERVEKAFDLVRNPVLWPGTTTDQLLDILYSVSEWLGSYYNEDLFEEFRPFYWYIAERTTVEQRLEVLVELVDGVGRFEVGTASLLPFLCADEETSVISTAALHLALLMPRRDGDPLTGPKYILSGLDSCDTENSLVGNLQGVLLLGDRRVLPLLDSCWERLGREGRRLLAHSWSGFVYASTIDFLLDWLEKTDDERDYGSIAAALVLCTIKPKNSPFVLDVERNFPANGEEEGPQVRFLHQWTFEEYGKVMAPRLKAIAAAEMGEKVMPKVLAAWGIVNAEQPAGRHGRMRWNRHCRSRSGRRPPNGHATCSRSSRRSAGGGTSRARPGGRSTKRTSSGSSCFPGGKAPLRHGTAPLQGAGGRCRLG